MATAQDLIAIAESQIGTCESPSGSNRVKYAEWYGMNGEPWCDMFVSWCADKAGALDIVGKYAYCPYHVDFFKKRGQWLDREEKPQPGDIVFFASKKTACHVGIVVSRNGSSSVTTIEGNTSAGSNANGGQVQKRTRTYGSVGSSWYILGFGRPEWSGTKSKPPSTSSITTSGVFDMAQLPTIRNGSGINNPNNSVFAMQSILEAKGYSVSGIDGEFGSKTETALRNFQKDAFPDQPSEWDGVCGQHTWCELLM